MEDQKEFFEARTELKIITKVLKLWVWYWFIIGAMFGILSLAMIGTIISDDFRIFVNELFGYGI